MRNHRGFTLIEMLLVITLIGGVLAILSTGLRWGERHAEQVASQLMSDFAAIESAVLSYEEDKNSYPAGLGDATFAPAYIFPPVVPTGFYTAYGVSGYNLDLRSGQPAPDNGYYICAKVSVPKATDAKYRAIKLVAGKIATSKFFYNTACPADSDMADPAGAATVYATYWITRY